MFQYVLEMYMKYRTKKEGKSQDGGAPKRIIFYRDGVSEGQFKQVLEQGSCSKFLECAFSISFYFFINRAPRLESSMQ